MFPTAVALTRNSRAAISATLSHKYFSVQNTIIPSLVTAASSSKLHSNSPSKSTTSTTTRSVTTVTMGETVGAEAVLKLRAQQSRNPIPYSSTVNSDLPEVIPRKSHSKVTIVGCGQVVSHYLYIVL